MESGRRLTTCAPAAGPQARPRTTLRSTARSRRGVSKRSAAPTPTRSLQGRVRRYPGVAFPRALDRLPADGHPSPRTRRSGRLLLLGGSRPPPHALGVRCEEWRRRRHEDRKRHTGPARREYVPRFELPEGEAMPVRGGLVVADAKNDRVYSLEERWLSHGSLINRRHARVRRRGARLLALQAPRRCQIR